MSDLIIASKLVKCRSAEAALVFSFQPGQLICGSCAYKIKTKSVEARPLAVAASRHLSRFHALKQSTENIKIIQKRASKILFLKNTGNRFTFSLKGVEFDEINVNQLDFGDEDDDLEESQEEGNGTEDEAGDEAEAEDLETEEEEGVEHARGAENNSFSLEVVTMDQLSFMMSEVDFTSSDEMSKLNRANSVHRANSSTRANSSARANSSTRANSSARANSSTRANSSARANSSNGANIINRADRHEDSDLIHLDSTMNSSFSLLSEMKAPISSNGSFSLGQLASTSVQAFNATNAILSQPMFAAINLPRIHQLHQDDGDRTIEAKIGEIIHVRVHGYHTIGSFTALRRFKSTTRSTDSYREWHIQSDVKNKIEGLFGNNRRPTKVVILFE